MLKNESLLLLSVNYLNKDIDFSFHCLSELYAKIEYVAKIKEDNENFIIQNITSIDENKEENLKKALQYLANRKINQYFCSTKESFRKEALLNIFTHAQKKIKRSVQPTFGHYQRQGTDASTIYILKKR